MGQDTVIYEKGDIICFDTNALQNKMLNEKNEKPFAKYLQQNNEDSFYICACI